jgi:hypothetical protein
MKTPTKETTHVGGVRMRDSVWVKLRELMEHHGGRLWLEKSVEREYQKIKRKPHNPS